MYKYILVPYDGSPASGRGLEEAIRLAKNQDACLQILNVIEEYQLTQNAGFDGGMYTGEMMELLIADGKLLAEQAVSKARMSGIAVFGTTIESFAARPAECVLDAARTWPADLIVMGTHGRRGISRLVMGSDAETVIRRANVPVLLVRAPEGVTIQQPLSSAKPSQTTA
jgi:nucleotide-binding universal stress UspA family protein